MVSTATHAHRLDLARASALNPPTPPLPLLRVVPPTESIMAAADPSTPDAGSSSQFSTKAMAYGSFMILLYFALAGVYCMCTMKFKRDSLLYSSGKAE